MADKYGRKKGVWLGSMFCIVGGSLQAGSQNTDMFICARVIAGIGIGFMNSIVPPWISELAKAHNRGANFAMIFISNCELPAAYSGTVALTQFQMWVLLSHTGSVTAFRGMVTSSTGDSLCPS